MWRRPKGDGCPTVINIFFDDAQNRHRLHAAICMVAAHDNNRNDAAAKTGINLPCFGFLEFGFSLSGRNEVKAYRFVTKTRLQN